MVLDVVPVSTTCPTPLVFALSTSHVHASFILLDGDPTLGAPLRPPHLRPAFVELGFGFLAAHPLVPCDAALKA